MGGEGGGGFGKTIALFFNHIRGGPPHVRLPPNFYHFI